MPSLMNGLSQMGAGIAQFAGNAGLEAQKADLQQKSIMLSAQLEHENRTAEIGQQGAIQAGIVGQQIAGQKDVAVIEAGATLGAANISAQAQTKIAALQDATRRATAELEAATSRANVGDQVAAQQKIAELQDATRRATAELEASTSRTNVQTQVNALPPDVKEATFLASATPEQRAAYREAQTARLGLPSWVTGGTGSGAGSPSSNSSSGGDAGAAPTSGAADSSGGAPAAAGAPSGAAAAAGRYNEAALKGLPPEATQYVKAMVEGRLQPPSSYAMARQGSMWPALIAKAMQYDPTFDETSWAGRVATRKDFTSGQAAKATTAINTALGHAGVVMDAFSALGNGSLPSLNAAMNWVDKQFGGEGVTNATEAVGALASEARKVFATTGGGNLTELENWEKNFPINGSPAQQQGAMKQFVNLLDSRLAALSDQYNRGMGTAGDPMALLQPQARAVYERLTGRQPENSTGYQSGKPPAGTPQPAAPSAPSAAVDPMTGSTVPTAPKPIGGTSAAPASPTGTPWQFGATLGDGSKAYSNDGQHWYDAGGKPLAGQ